MLAATPLSAQFRAGVKAGANLSSMDMSMSGVELEIYEPRMGYHAGLIAEFMFSARFGLYSELVYMYSGSEINAAKYVQGTEMPGSVSLEGYMGMNTIRMPLGFKARFPLTRGTGFYVAAGGFASYASSAEQHVRIAGGGESVKFKWSLYDTHIEILDRRKSNVYMQRRFNAGLSLGAGVEFARGAVVSATFERTLANMAAFGYLVGGTSLKPDTRMWTAGLSVGYMF